MRDLLLNATLDYFIAQKSSALANLNVYLEASVGVGEHPDLIKETARLVVSIAEADEAIAVINDLLEKRDI